MESSRPLGNIRSFTSEHHEANAQDIRRLDSFDTIFKTYVVTDSDSDTEQSPLMEQIKVKPVKARNKTFRSLFNWQKNKKKEDQLSQFRIASGKNLPIQPVNSRNPKLNEEDESEAEADENALDQNSMTPTNSNSNLSRLFCGSTRRVSYEDYDDDEEDAGEEFEQRTSTSGLQSSESQFQYQNNDYCCCCRECNGNFCYPDQCYYCDYIPGAQMGKDTQNFGSTDECCCQMNDLNGFPECGGYDSYMRSFSSYAPQQQHQQQHEQQQRQQPQMDMDQEQFQPQYQQQSPQHQPEEQQSQQEMQQQQLSDMAQQIAQQLAQQFVQNQMMSQCSSQSMNCQPMMSQPMMGNQSMVGQSGYECADQQQFNNMNMCDMGCGLGGLGNCGGLGGLAGLGGLGGLGGFGGIGGLGALGGLGGLGGNNMSNYCCSNDLGKSNCIDVDSFIKTYPRGEACTPGLTVMKDNNNNNCMCNIFDCRRGGAQSSYLNDAMHSESVYSSDYKPPRANMCSPFGSNMGHMGGGMSFPLTSSSFGSNCECPMTCPLAPGCTPYMTSMPTGDCCGGSFPMQMSPQSACYDHNQNY